jgi:hypothetical protein
MASEYRANACVCPSAQEKPTGVFSISTGEYSRRVCTNLGATAANCPGSGLSPGGSWYQTAAVPLPRFRTIQICHKDLPATPGQAGTKWEESSK